MARVVFLGTPEAAVPGLLEVARCHDVVVVVTQPDRPKGRSAVPVAPPVKVAALELGLAVAQPENREELNALVSAAAPLDVGVVIAFGRILSPKLLETPSHGMVNVHFSLLPRWRGAAPVERALIAGDPMSGVTIIKLDEGLDTGPVLTAQAIDIGPSENSGELTRRLADLGARLLVDVLDDYISGGVVPVEQADEGATYADKITARDRPLDPNGDVAAFVSRVRGLAPRPGATLDIAETTHKILAARPHPAEIRAGSWEVRDGVPVVGVGNGSVELLIVQPPGKREMAGSSWARGLRETSGVVA